MPAARLPVSSAERADLAVLRPIEFQKKYGWSKDRYYRAIGKGRSMRPTAYVPQRVQDAVDSIHIPTPVAAKGRITPLIRLVDRDFVVAGDFHVPFHDPLLLALIIAVGQRDDVGSLVINGDFLDLEGFFSMDEPTGQPGKTVTFDQELEAASLTLEVLFRYFQDIYWDEGNHDNRLFRATGRRLNMDHLARLVAPSYDDRLHVTSRDYVEAFWSDRPEDSWRVTHGDGSRGTKSPTTGPKDMAEILNMNVAQGHNHIVGISQTKDGRHWGVSHGCVVDPALVAYKQSRTTTHSQWVQGFGVVRRGTYRQYTKNGVDWEFELRGRSGDGLAPGR